jgi:hypothetical protein
MGLSASEKGDRIEREGIEGVETERREPGEDENTGYWRLWVWRNGEEEGAWSSIGPV